MAAAARRRRGGRMIQAEILRPPLALDDLRAAWDALYARSGREPSLSFAWSRAILRNHLAGRDDWFIVVLRRAGRIAGLVPMLTSRERLLGRPVTILQPIQEKYNTHSDLLFEDDGAELVGAWLDAIRSRQVAWDLLRMSRLLEHGAFAASLAGELERRRARCRWRLERPSFHLPLPATYDGYLAQRSGKLRNYLKRAEKKLAAEGAVTFTRVRPDAPIADAYADLLAVERDSWKHGHGTAISTVAHQEGFYRELAETAQPSGMLHLTFLRLDGVAIAYNLGLVSAAGYAYLKTSYRHAYRAYGAASIGRARLIEQLVAEGAPALDFPGEPYEWEQQWTDDVRWHRSLLLFNRTLAGQAIALMLGARQWLRPVPEDRRLVFVDARALRAEDAAQ
jgi:CelD/BcsL family acetyltransferase involved in cellulose biosynthesis